MKLIRIKKCDDIELYKITVAKSGEVLKIAYTPREAKIFIASVNKYGPLKVFVSKWNREKPNEYNWKPTKLNQEGVVT